MINKNSLPHEVLTIIDILANNGYEAFVVGGCVRDTLMGRVPHDWDICTDALPEQVINCFESVDSTIVPTGLKHGTVTVLLNGSKNGYEITTYRIDGEYTDSRHPESVEFVSDIDKDLARRDFTMNAIAYSPYLGLRDPFGGCDDIEKGTIRCVGNPLDRFDEDALRILRALRFSITLHTDRYEDGFTIEDKTKQAMWEKESLLLNVSAERVRDEVIKALSSSHIVEWKVDFLLCLLSTYIPELRYETCMEDWAIKKRVICNVSSLNTKIASLFWLKNSADVENVLKKMKFDNKTIDSVMKIHNTYMMLVSMPRLVNYECPREIKSLLRFIGYDNLVDAIEYYRCSPLCSSVFATEMLHKYVDDVIRKNECYTLSQLNINGDDLLGLGIVGEPVGQCLDYLLYEVYGNNSLNVKETLVEKAKAWKGLHK